MFGDSTRIRVLWALDHAELCVCDIAVLLNMTKSAISHQLRVLRESKLVKTRREGRLYIIPWRITMSRKSLKKQWSI